MDQVMDQALDDTEPLAQLIAIADTDKVARLRLLRALRDLGTSGPDH